jgi:hypothetical protein
MVCSTFMFTLPAYTIAALLQLVTISLAGSLASKLYGSLLLPWPPPPRICSPPRICWACTIAALFKLVTISFAGSLASKAVWLFVAPLATSS